MREKIIKNGWTQGCILKYSDIKEDYILSREGKFKETTLLLIISQSCDVVNDFEKHIECLALKKIKETQYKCDFSTGQNPRKLHLELSGEYYEILAFEFVFIKKQYFIDNKFLNEFTVDCDKLNIIRAFKANRYIRTGLPESTAKLIEQSIFKSGELMQCLSRDGHTLHSIRIQVNESPEGIKHSIAVIILIKQMYFDQYLSVWEERFDRYIRSPMEEIEEIELIDVNHRFGLDDVMNASDFGIELAPKFPRFFYDALSMAPDSFDDVSDD